jgi:uncharacterized membrane protein YgcG
MYLLLQGGKIPSSHDTERGIRSVKEAMAVTRGGHLPNRVGREFARNLIWILAVFGPLAAFLFFAAGTPLVGLLAFVGICVLPLAAIVTLLALWSGAPDETLLRGYSDLTPRSGGGYGASDGGSDYGGGFDYGGGGGDGGGGGG